MKDFFAHSSNIRAIEFCTHWKNLCSTAEKDVCNFANLLKIITLKFGIYKFSFYLCNEPRGMWVSKRFRKRLSEIRIFMKLRYIISSLLISTCLLSVNGQTTKKKSSIHSKAHKEQLANVKSRMDKSVISNMLQEEVALREKENSLSKESDILLSDLLKEANKHIG